MSTHFFQILQHSRLGSNKTELDQPVVKQFTQRQILPVAHRTYQSLITFLVLKGIVATSAPFGAGKPCSCSERKPSESRDHTLVSLAVHAQLAQILCARLRKELTSFFECRRSAESVCCEGTLNCQQL